MRYFTIAIFVLFSLCMLGKIIIIANANYPRKAEYVAWKDVADVVIYIAIVVWSAVLIF